MLMIAVALILFIGIAHSYLGEKYILSRLSKRALPALFGGGAFTKQTLRFVWHITTVAWFGFGAILLSMLDGNVSEQMLLRIIGFTFGIGALFPLILTRGKHLSWIVFVLIAGICLLASSNY